MAKLTTHIDVNERIEWTGRHDLLDGPDDKVRLEAAILRLASDASRFRIDVSDTESLPDGRRVRPTLCVYLKSGENVCEWLTLQGGQRNAWIPQFAEQRWMAMGTTSGAPQRGGELPGAQSVEPVAGAARS